MNTSIQEAADPSDEVLKAMHLAYWRNGEGEVSMHWHENSRPLWLRTFNAARAALTTQAPAEPALPSWWNEFIGNVCEIPDRNSPEDEPEAMVATAQELENCALRAIESAALAVEPGNPANQAGLIAQTPAPAGYVAPTTTLTFTADLNTCDVRDTTYDTPLPVFRDQFKTAGARGGEVADGEGPEFTDSARNALLWVLWHHQGGSSPVGQPIRFALGMGQHDRMTADQVERAKRWGDQEKGSGRDVDSAE